MSLARFAHRRHFRPHDSPPPSVLTLHCDACMAGFYAGVPLALPCECPRCGNALAVVGTWNLQTQAVPSGGPWHREPVQP